MIQREQERKRKERDELMEVINNIFQRAHLETEEARRGEEEEEEGGEG